MFGVWLTEEESYESAPLQGGVKGTKRKLRDYTEMIRLNDKGSRVILQTEMEDENAQPKFKRMYIRYNAQKLGFLGGCRPIIGLDGCHLKGRFGGQILSTIARNANDNIFLVAFAVVEQENKDS